MNMTKTFAETGTHYCFAEDKKTGRWINMGMVPENDRLPFVTEFKARYGGKVAFVPFCFAGKNSMSLSQIYSYGLSIQ